MARLKGSKNKPKQVVDSQPTSKIVEIPIDMLVIDKINIRDNPTKNLEKKTEMEQDIKNNGIINPLLVRLNPITNKYGIVAGSQRFYKAMRAGLKSLPCIVREMDDITAKARSIAENKFQQPLEAYEYQKALKELYDMIEKNDIKLTKNGIIAVITEKTGFAESTIKGYLVIAEHATSETKEAMKKGKLGDSRVAQDIARLPEEKQKEAIEKIENKPRSEAHAIIQQVKAKTKPTKTEPQKAPIEQEPLFTTLRTITEMQALRKEVFESTGNNAKFTQDEWLTVEDKFKHYAFCVGVEQVLNYLEAKKHPDFSFLFKPNFGKPSKKPVKLETQIATPEYVTEKVGKTTIAYKKKS